MMVATHSLSPLADVLARGDAALLAALDRLAEARVAYARGGRVDLAGLLGSAASLTRQARDARAFEPGTGTAHDPADWFLE